MENDQFDALIRTLSGADSSRRETLRVLRGMLLGGALSGVVARLGLGEGAAAKGKKHQKAKSKRQRKARTEHWQHGQFEAEGQHKGKGKGKHHKHRPHDPTPPPPLPPGCENCNECQMCQDGACVPDPALDGVRCLGSGATCGNCQGGQCTASALPPCPDGTCPQRDQCCPGEKKCADRESQTGFACLGADDCCPDEKKCAGGCVYKQACCPEERTPCGQCGEICVNGTWQCSAQKSCANGSCVAHDECCPEERQCADGTCVAQGSCCRNDPVPPCDACEAAVCASGEWVCQVRDDCGPPCFWGYCPKGYECNGYGVCCDWGTGHCTCSSGSKGGQGCNGKCCPNGCCGSGCCPS
jgi:hypothetical protein